MAPDPIDPEKLYQELMEIKGDVKATVRMQEEIRNRLHTLPCHEHARILGELRGQIKERSTFYGAIAGALVNLFLKLIHKVF